MVSFAGAVEGVVLIVQSFRNHFGYFRGLWINLIKGLVMIRKKENMCATQMRTRVHKIKDGIAVQHLCECMSTK